MLKIPSTIRKDLLDFKIRVLDVHDPVLEERLKDRSFKSRGFLKGLKNIWSLKADEESLEEFIQFFDNWTGPPEDLIFIIGNYLWAGVSDMTQKLWDRFEASAVRRGIFPKGGYMNAREYLREYLREEVREEGWQEGLQKGMEKGMKKGMQTGLKTGRQEGRQEVVLNMLQAKADIPFISKMTGFSEEEIKKLEKKP